MLNLIKRFLIVGTVVLAVSAPSIASARFNLNPPASPATTSQAARPVVLATAPVTASPTQGFQWADAAVGAAVVLLLAGVGVGAALTQRRRAQQPATS
jgi:hypothetical protein